MAPKLRLVEDQRPQRPGGESGETTGELREQIATDRELIASMAAEGVVDRKLIATLAAEGVASRREIEQVKTALATARRIGAAIGILMYAKHISEEQAFDVLTNASKRSNRKLREVADELCDTGDMSAMP